MINLNEQDFKQIVEENNFAKSGSDKSNNT